MKKALLLISTIATLQAQAQNVGINTSAPDASAILDITHTNRGLLIPRIVLTDVTLAAPITAPALSLLVFNTNTTVGVNGVKPGYYYWDGAKWVGIGTGSAWELLGNAGTAAGTNFLGTTDNQDLVFKRNNVQSGLLNAALGNTSFGVLSFNATATGINNTAVGGNTLINNTTGAQNTALGFGALQGNTTGNQNTAVGTGVLSGAGLLGSRNTAIGNQLLYSNTTGVGNVAVGYDNLLTNTTGNNNVALGGAVLGVNTVGNYNIGIGAINLTQNTTGTNNIAMGYSTMTGNTTGAGNVAIGAESYRDANGSGNLSLGTWALRAVTGLSNNNVAMGYRAGDNFIDAPVVSDNILLGAEAGTNVRGNNNIAVGANTTFANATFNNQLNIGNCIYGTGFTGGGAGNVGIGTAAPANKLEITHGTAGNSGLRFTNLPNATALSTNASGDVIPTTLNPANALYWGLTGNSGTTPATNFVGTTDAQDLVFKTNSVENMRVTSGGNVGIGTTSPIAKLDVQNSMILAGTTSATNGSIILAGQYGDTTNMVTLLGTEYSSGGPSLSYGVKQAFGTSGFINTYSLTPINRSAVLVGGGGGGPTSALRIYGTAQQTIVGKVPHVMPELMRVNSDGNVGIGTTAPTYKLHVANGSVKVDGTANTGANSALLMFGLNNSTDIGYVGDGSTTDNNMYLYSYSNDVRIGTGVLSSASNSIYLDQAGNTGIGTIPASSSAKLDVVSTTSGFAMPRMTSAQRKAIVAPIAGLDVYDLTLKGHYTFDGTKWDCSDNPAGSVNYFANATAPNGYLECNGQSVSTTTYAELFAAIGYLYGGAGASFNVPDLRGEFIRGVDNARGVDAGRVIGAWQSGSLDVGDDGNDINCMQVAGGGFAPANGYDAITIADKNIIYPSARDISGGGSPTAPLVGYYSVTNPTGSYFGISRPRNVAMLPCIKF